MKSENEAMDLDLDWNLLLSDRSTDPSTESSPSSPISIADSLIRSLSERNRVDLSFMKNLTGRSVEDIVEELSGTIFQNPDTWHQDPLFGWETSDVYLSGNLRKKLISAQQGENHFPGRFERNIQAIQTLLPPETKVKEVYVTLGTPWIPVWIINQFISWLYGMPKGWMRRYEGTVHDEKNGIWELKNHAQLDGVSAVSEDFLVTSHYTYGTKRVSAMDLIEHALNMRPVVVYDEKASSVNDSGKKKVLNRDETVAAEEKMKIIRKRFSDWIWQDDQRRETLLNLYDDQFGTIRRKIFHGQFLEFPTMSPDIHLYPYQKDAVARILFSKNTLLAHQVGAGKTYVMIAAGMELLRTRQSEKNLYVVPNQIVSQWEQIFHQMYPSANVLVVYPGNFQKKNRAAILSRIQDEQFDGILMAASCFDLIPISTAHYLETCEEELAEWRKIEQSGKMTGEGKRKKAALQKKIEKLKSGKTDAETITFEELKIDRLFVDEAHHYKNITIGTSFHNYLGISSTGSAKCDAMLEKVRIIQKNHAGGGVVMATGTPITNSVTDAFVMQKYLQGGELAALDISTFDAWAGMFAEPVTRFEIDVDTNTFRLATRFSHFHNLKALSTLLNQFASFYVRGDQAGLPVFRGYSDKQLPQTPELKMYLKTLSKRADEVRQGDVNRRDDNMLKITTDGRKAALDLRLIDESIVVKGKTKAEICGEKAAEIYQKTKDQSLTQLIFCDASVPSDHFNLYQAVREELLKRGVEKEEIAFIHDARTETQRDRLFQRVRQGKIRILLGSTMKLGSGVNVQDRLIAIHHLDVPWRPADMTQREGRILRQGNQNPEVWIFRYITKGSFDAYSWQLLETKQQFISSLLSGTMTEDSAGEIENVVLNYAEVKALAVGNPEIRERVETENELNRYRLLQQDLVRNRLEMERELETLPERIRRKRVQVSQGKEKREALQKLQELLKRLQSELANEKSYVDEIRECEERLRNIDQKLGVEIHESDQNE